MINILFSGNSKVFDGALTTMLSIFKRTTTKEPFKFYIYTMDITRIKPEYTPISAKRKGVQGLVPGGVKGQSP